MRPPDRGRAIVNAEELAAALLPALLDLIEAERKPPPIVTADELAAYLKVSREVIYRNAERLGAIRLGDGPRARLRFRLDAEQVRAWQAGQPKAPPATAPKRRTNRPRPGAGADLLPIRGR